MHHSRYIPMLRTCRNTLTGVPIARAGASYHHLIDGIVVLLHHLLLVLQQVVITKSVKPSECESKVSEQPKIVYHLAVRVESGIKPEGPGPEHFEDDLGNCVNLCLNLCHISPLLWLMGRSLDKHSR